MGASVDEVGRAEGFCDGPDDGVVDGELVAIVVGAPVGSWEGSTITAGAAVVSTPVVQTPHAAQLSSATMPLSMSLSMAQNKKLYSPGA